ncbi:cupin domain-containing protein [Sulfitobacter sp. S0837]|uniref:(R)-mandelonitrile lyase n=1 Tax=Sulfitobacter maritimus TaxID=2741719 RepID=UPI001582D3F5|nr:cupin domain-containing protein [Sulfitobacter maritimus]NUH65824.1 cupin domain-containing protein [Sulfitobacter maritimus]
MIVHPANSRPSEAGPEDYFTGAVKMTPLISAPAPARLRGVSVTFQPGARTAWHVHPLGQTLIVTQGTGRAQTEGGPIQILNEGDVVWFDAGEKHWHGAAPDSAMTHIALQEAEVGGAVEWLEKVSDEDYDPA